MVCGPGPRGARDHATWQPWMSRLELWRREVEACAGGVLISAMGTSHFEISAMGTSHFEISSKSRGVLTCSHEAFCS